MVWLHIDNEAVSTVQYEEMFFGAAEMTTSAYMGFRGDIITHHTVYSTLVFVLNDLDLRFFCFFDATPRF